jgi:hypothetical protein
MFGVFVDRQPMRPGQSLRVFGDDACKRTRGCPDAHYLAQRRVYVTTEEGLSLDALPSHLDRYSGTAHEITVVLLDADGRRIGEAAYTVEFFVPHAGSASP